MLDGSESFGEPAGVVEFFVEPAPCPYPFFVRKSFESGDEITLDLLEGYHFDADKGFCDAKPAQVSEVGVGSFDDYEIYYDLLAGETVSVGIEQFITIQMPVSSSIIDAECREYDLNALDYTTDDITTCGDVAGEITICSGEIVDNTCVHISTQYCVDKGGYYDPTISTTACIIPNCERVYGEESEFFASYEECGERVLSSEVCKYLESGYSYVYDDNVCRKYLGEALSYNPTWDCIEEERVAEPTSGDVFKFYCEQEPFLDCEGGRFFFSDRDNLACVVGYPDCGEDEIDIGNGVCLETSMIVVTKYEDRIIEVDKPRYIIIERIIPEFVTKEVWAIPVWVWSLIVFGVFVTLAFLVAKKKGK